MTANVIILAGYGLNCEEETLHAYEYVGLKGKIIHINDLIETPSEIDSAQILTIPGGFSYGDDTGAGNAYAQKLKLALWDQLQSFVSRDTLTLGICNGCQILANLGLVTGFNGEYGDRKVAVTYNASDRYQCRWIDLKVQSASPWLQDVNSMHIPVAHGEGRFMMENDTINALKNNNQIAATYAKPDGSPANVEFPFNPNGSAHDIAAITDQSGKVLAMMPHPERGMFTWQRDDYMNLKDRAQRENNALTEEADGLALFKNAARHFS